MMFSIDAASVRRDCLVVAALLLLLAAGTELKFGIDAEGKPLESIADPLSS
jgi:hypothetical protein